MRLWPLVAAIATTLFLVAAPAARAANSPDLTAGISSQSVLYGDQAQVTVSASNPSGPYGYNLSFRVVLPAGVSYAGGAPVAPQQIANQPAANQTTLIFANVSDLSPGSSKQLGFNLTYSHSTYDVGATFSVGAQAFANSEPRYAPKFLATGAPDGPRADSYTGNSPAVSGTQTLTAIRVTKTEPSAEGELLRGVHDHQTVYTLNVNNNSVNPTSGVTLEDYLPAGLEFLGCGGAGADHTTDAPTNPGSNEEHPGSGPIIVPTLAGCTAPLTVATENVDPDGPVGPLPSGVYTHVTWSVGTLAAGDARTFTYRAAVPLRANTLTFTGTQPTPASLGQATNLDNNSGPEVTDETVLRTYAHVAGTYNGATAVSDATTLTRTAEDWVVRKAASSGTLAQGALTTWTLTFQTSEYKFVDHATVTDTLPNGLCPLGATNLAHNADSDDAECAPVGGQTPLRPYTSATENTDGTWTLQWDESTFPQLAHTSVNDTFTLTFPTRTRESYQSNYGPTTPLLTRDAITNVVTTSAIDGVDGSPIDDAGSAAQTAGDPVIGKQIAASGTDCKTATYVGTVPHYHPGDRICWKLRVDFPGALDTSPQAVADFLPPSVSYVNGSEVLTDEDDVDATINESDAPGGLLRWTVNDTTVPTGGRVFERTIATIAQPPGTPVNGDIVGNLLKFSSTNTQGVSVPQRAEANFELDTPVPTLTKGVQEIVRGGSTVPGPNGPNVDNRTVVGGDAVTYRVDVTNSGAQDARNVVVWDMLPAEYPCSTAVTAISNSGACGTSSRVEWTIPTLAAGATKTLTYTATVPATIGPARTIDNHTGVRSFQGATNLGGFYDYRPVSNIDGSPVGVNAPAADDSSRVTARDVTVAKSATTGVTEAGNAVAQATIGEQITYTVTATIPEGTQLGGAVALTDTLDSTTRQPYVGGSAVATLDGGALTAGFSLDTSGATPRVVFPNDYANAPGSGDDIVVLTFQTVVADVAGNSAGSANLTNRATLFWTDPVTNAQTRTSPTVSTAIVEPQISQTKTDNTGGARVNPGDIVTYTVRTSDAGASAHAVALSDTVPVGLTPIDSNDAALNDGDTVPGSGSAVWDAGSRTITKTVGTIAPGGNFTFTYRTRIDNPAVGGATLTNTVAAIAASLDFGGRTTGSRYAASATETVRIGTATVTKSGTPATATIGAPVSYTVRVTVPASIAVHDLTVTDVVPDAIDVDGYTIEACVSGCPVPNAINRYTKVVNGNGTTTLAWDFGDIATPLGTPLVVDLTYSGHVRATHRNGGANVVRGQTAVNSVTVASNRTNQDGAFAAGTIPTGFDDTSSPATATTTVTEPKLTVDKAVSVSGGAHVNGPAPAQSNDTLAYRVVVTNTGNAAAYDVAVTDRPDGELAGVTLDPQAGVTVTDGWTAGDPAIAWRIDGPIAPGASVTLTYSASLVAASTLHDGQTIANTAAVPHYFGASTATRTANPTTVYRDYTDGGSDAVNVVLDFPTFSAVKTTGAAGSPDSANAEVGQDFAWRVVVTNSSATATASDVQITDTLPASWDYRGGTTAGASEPAVTGGTLVWTLPSLAPGASATITYKARALPGAAAVGVNTARVTAAHDEAGNAGSGDGAYGSGSDSASATLLTPALALAKSPKHGAATAGSASSFTLTVANGGTATARNLDVTDVLPAGLAYTAGTATATPAAGFSETSRAAGPGAGETTVHWHIGTLAAGASVTITVPVTVAADVPSGTTLVNTASVGADELVGTTSDTGSLDVTTSADVAIVKTGAATYTPGTNYTWHLRVRNLGPSDAHAVSVSDPLPAGTSFVSADAPCTQAGGTVTCALGTLAPGADRTYDVVVAGDAGRTGALSNTATVATTTPDGNAANNGSTASATAAALADVSVTKSASPSAVLRGHDTTFTLTVHNAGPSVARGVTLSDVLPAQLPFVSVDSASCAGGATVSCAFGDLAPGADVVVHVAARAALDGTWTNTATVATTTTEPGGGAPDSASADVTVGPVAELAISKTGPATVAAGGELTWAMKVTNRGPNDATGVTVTDPLPAGTAFVSADAGCTPAGDVVTCAVGALANGAATTRHITVKVPVALADTSVLNTATVTGDQGDDDPTNDSASASTAVGPAADLAIAKTGPATVAAGRTITWTLTASNAGRSTATGVRVSDALPAGVELVSATPSQGSCTGAVECALGTLASGSAAQIQVVAQVPAALEGVTLVNRATVAGDQPDPNQGNDAAQAATVVGAPDVGDFDLALVKRVAPGQRPELGKPLRYTLDVTDTGPARATSIKLVDTLPGGESYVSAALPGGKCAEKGGVVTCTLPALDSGASAHATVTVMPTQAGRLVNTASISSAVADRDPSNDRSTAPVDIIAHHAVLRIVKAPLIKGGVVAAGHTVRMRIRVTNTSTNAANAVVVCDDPGTSTTYVRASGARYQSGRPCWTVGFLPAHASRTVTVTVRVNRRTTLATLRSGASVKAKNARTKHHAAKLRIKRSTASNRGGGVTG